MRRAWLNFAEPDRDDVSPKRPAHNRILFLSAFSRPGVGGGKSGGGRSAGSDGGSAGSERGGPKPAPAALRTNGTAPAGSENSGSGDSGTSWRERDALPVPPANTKRVPSSRSLLRRPVPVREEDDQQHGHDDDEQH